MNEEEVEDEELDDEEVEEEEEEDEEEEGTNEGNTKTPKEFSVRLQIHLFFVYNYVLCTSYFLVVWSICSPKI